MIKAVIFDLDNTLYRIPEDFDKAVIGNIYRFYKSFFGLQTDESVKKKLSELKREYGSNPRAFYFMNEAPRFFEEIYRKVEPSKYLARDEKLIELLSGLKIKKAIFTNGPDFFANKIIKCLGLDGLIDCKEYGNTCEPKPSTNGFEKILECLDVNPKDCLMVGDTPDEDLSPAEKLGMETAIIKNGKQIFYLPENKNLYLGVYENIYDFLGELNDKN